MLGSILNKIIPKKTNRIFFEDSVTVRENHYYLYSYMIENGYDKIYDIIYYPDKISICSKNTISSYILILKRILWSFTSKYIITSYGPSGYLFKATQKQLIIYIGHGIGIKKIGYALCSDINNKHNKMSQRCQYFVAPSKFFLKTMIASFNCLANQVIFMGAPKNDYLFKNIDINMLYEKKLCQFNKIVVFLPTYRNAVSLGFNKHSVDFPLINKENIDKLNFYLNEIGCYMIVKFHPSYQNTNLLNIEKDKYTNMIFLTNIDLDVLNIPLYSLLKRSDALITDYSSVFQDYLLLNKPIGFVLSDLNEYINVRGLNFEDPLSLMPGHKIYNFNDLIQFLEDVIQNHDLFAQQRENMNILFNVEQNGNNCKQLLEFMGVNIN